MDGLTLVDELRHLAAQCAAQAEWPANAAAHREFIYRMIECLHRLDGRDCQNFRGMLTRVCGETSDEELPQLLVDCAGYMGLIARSAVIPGLRAVG